MMNKIVFLALAFLYLSVSAQTQPISEILKQAKELETARNEKGALEKYKQAVAIDKNNLQALCGASFMCSRIGNRETSEAAKKQMFILGRTYAEMALKINENSDQAHYVMAVAMGRMALISGSKEKVAASRKIKYHADKALMINPNHAGAWHVIGKWNYEVAQLGSITRSVAKNFLGGLPDGSLENAIKYYEKCRSLDKTYIVNLYDLAIAYNKAGNDKKAIECVDLISTCAVRFYDDTFYKAEAAKLKIKWSSK